MAFDLKPLTAEDGTNGYWDARRMGNGQGKSFVIRNGVKTFVSDEELAQLRGGGGEMPATAPAKKGFDIGQILADPSFTNFASNALSDLGYGLTRGKNLNEGFQLATQRTAEMDPMRTADAEKRQLAEESITARNKTVAYLRSQPGGAQFADAIENGMIDGSTAFKSWLDASKGGGGEAFTLSEGQVRYGPNGEVIATGAPKMPDPKDAFSMEKDLSSQYLGTDPVKTYQTIRNGYEKIRSSASLDSGPGDISTIFAYMKMLDPTSVVREGEFATAENSGGVGEQISNLYNRVLSGERLTPELRKQFMASADQIYKEAAGNLSDINSQYSTRATGWNVDPSRFIISPETYGAEDPLGLR